MGRPLIDLVGQTFGRLVVIELIGRGDHCTFWKCRCDCGKEIRARSHSLRGGSHRSCGCVPHNLAHGHARNHKRTREYVAWLNMRQRCTDPNTNSYERYGGRGIRVCDRWTASFEAFLEDMGVKPGVGYSIDRIDNDGNYEPGNCRWASPTEQRRNMSSNHIVEIEGHPYALSEACERLGLKYNNVRTRILRGKTFDEACY